MVLDLELSTRLVEGKFTAFRAMGTNVEISVWGSEYLSNQLIQLAPIRLEMLEQSWSRFRSDSELSQINQLHCAFMLEVSDDMAELLNQMKQAIEITGGGYFPHIEETMKAIGYDRSFEQITDQASSQTISQINPLLSNFVLEQNYLTFQKPLQLDAGGIGKGLTGDIICREFMSLGATGVLANIGGDLVATGSPAELSWQLGITNDSDENRMIGKFQTNQKKVAIATSSVAKRHWGKGRHHIINPETSDVAELDISQISVIAKEGWKAEALTKAAMLKGFDGAGKYLNNFGSDYLIVSSLGEIRAKGVQLC